MNVDMKPVMYISALHIFWPFDPSLYVDITHLLSGKEGIIFQYNVIRIPNDDTQLIASCNETRLGYFNHVFKAGIVNILLFVNHISL